MADDLAPYLIAAFFCERVIQETDGTLSAIRIIDRIELQTISISSEAAASSQEKPTEPVKLGSNVIKLQGLVAIKGGPLSGNFKLKVIGNSPSGDSREIFNVPVELKGGDQGQNVILNMFLATDKEGLFWFDVNLDEKTLSRIPLMVVRSEPTQLETSHLKKM